MTMIFNETEAPSALDDALPGCPVRKKIDAVCTEPGCPNYGLDPLRQQLIQLEDCIRVDEPPSPARPLWQRALTPSPRQKAAQIYQTQPKDRCVM
jgi:hypothetical protein